MTEREKMLDGQIYNSRDPELLAMYHRARKLLKAFNGLDSTMMEERGSLLTELLAHMGSGVWIEAPFYCDYGEHISIGANTFINTNCMFLDDNQITIDGHTSIAFTEDITARFEAMPKLSL